MAIRYEILTLTQEQGRSDFNGGNATQNNGNATQIQLAFGRDIILYKQYQDRNQDRLSYVCKIFASAETPDTRDTQNTIVTYFKLARLPDGADQQPSSRYIIISRGYNTIGTSSNGYELHIPQPFLPGDEPGNVIDALPYGAKNAVFCYIFALASIDRFTYYFNEAASASSGEQGPKISRLAREINEFDFKYFHDNPATQADRATNALWKRIAKSTRVQDTRTKAKKYIFALTSNIESSSSEKASYLAFYLALMLAFPAIFIAVKESWELFPHPPQICGFDALVFACFISIALFMLLAVMLDPPAKESKFITFLLAFFGAFIFGVVLPYSYFVSHYLFTPPLDCIFTHLTFDAVHFTTPPTTHTPPCAR